MGAIYLADVWCNGCADSIKDRIALELWNGRNVEVTPDGVKVSEFTSFGTLRDYLESMSEYDYDSDAWPKYCDEEAESDVPEHCAGLDECVESTVLSDGSKVGYFFRNALTLHGDEYIGSIIRDDLEAVHTDSVACEVWKPFYDYISFPG